MINIIIFSRDRGAQLELLLRSMKIHFNEWKTSKINILYTYSNNLFNEGYKITKKLHPEFNYKLEKNFKNDLIPLIDKNKKFSVFFVDDIIFKEDFSLFDDKIKILENDKNILCLSLRLHPHLTYCYPARVKMVNPKPDENNKFNWINKTGDYSYPMSLDGSIFRTNEILPILLHLNYNNPNTLESRMASNPIQKPFMLMYEKSKIINNPANKVQTFNENIHGNISAEFINNQYLNGKKISLKNSIGINNISCHQEIDIIFD